MLTERVVTRSPMVDGDNCPPPYRRSWECGNPLFGIRGQTPPGTTYEVPVGVRSTEDKEGLLKQSEPSISARDVPSWMRDEVDKINDNSELSNVVRASLRARNHRPNSCGDRILVESDSEWELSEEVPEIGMRITLSGCGDREEGMLKLRETIEMEKENRAMEKLLLERDLDIMGLDLPKTYAREAKESSLRLALNKKVALTRTFSSCPVVIKRYIPGKKIPWADEFFEDNGYLLRTHRFRHPACKDSPPLESQSGLITAEDFREMDMVRDNVGFEILPSLEEHYSPDGVGLLQKVENLSLYPDLARLSSVPPNLIPGIDGARFQVLTKPGGELEVIAKRQKDKAKPDKIPVLFGNKEYTTNTVYPGVRLPPGKFKTRGHKVWVESDSKGSVVILYTTLLACLIGVLSAAKPTGIICGNDKHGTLWKLPPQRTCNEKHAQGDKVDIDLYVKPASFAVESYSCYEHIETDVTMLGFFGTKSHLSHSEVVRHVSASECKAWALTKNTDKGKLLARGEGAWSTGNEHSYDYSYCCASDTYTTSNFHLKKINVTVYPTGSGIRMLSADADLSKCDYHTGSCDTKDRSVIWESKDVGCVMEHLDSGNFTRLSDGSLFNSVIQISLQVTEPEEVCGRKLYRTAQGFYVFVKGTLRHTYPREKRDMDAAEKNFLLSASQLYTDQVVEGIYQTQCANDIIMSGYLREMGKSNPSRLARAYFLRNDIAAKLVGEAYLVWECAKAEITKVEYSHKVEGVCYDLVPIEYEWMRDTRKGFLDTETNEIHPLSGTHDCNSVEGYVHNVDGEQRIYGHDGKFEITTEVNTIPGHAVREMTEHFFFKNTELHSVYGPAGSRYQESILSEIAGLAGHMVVSPSAYANPEYSGMVKEKVHGIKDMMKGWVMGPWLVLAKIALIVVASLIVYYVIRAKIQKTGLAWPSISPRAWIGTTVNKMRRRGMDTVDEEMVDVKLPTAPERY